jgi:phospholipid-binding lipoprotein MlaA
MMYRSSLFGCVVAGLLLEGCATAPNPQDPLEKFNRAVFTFNDAVDRAALKPAATAYKQVTPGFLQTGVNNFFGNLSDVWSAVNNLAQGKGQDGMSDLTRFAVNSTFGILGVLDIATPGGLRKHNEDLGQTLGYWGVSSGPYLMLPLLGPSTFRDTAALPADLWGDPWSHKTPVNWRNVGIGVRAIDQRAAILDASNLLEDAALDRYEFIRDSYLQRRASRVYDDERSQKKQEEKRQNNQGQEEPSGKVDMKAAYGDDNAAPAPAGAPVPAPAPMPPSSEEPQK